MWQTVYYFVVYKQCIALCGDHESINTPGSCGNFLSLLKLLSYRNEVFHNHLNSTAMKSVPYTSPQTQNELIEIMGKNTVLNNC